MKPMLISRGKAEGFALPTIIIASVIMLIVLVTSSTAVGSITTSLAGQYYNDLAREAAESGLANARACLRASSYAPTWTDAQPLMPNTGCYGEIVGSLSQWLVSNGNIRSTFSVGLPQTGSTSSLRIISQGTVNLVRNSDPNQIWRQYSYVAADNSRYNDIPQIAGGAGWKDGGHNGYMLASNGILYGWGDNTYEQLGSSSLGTTVATPIEIALPTGITRAKKVFNSGQGASILCILGTDASLGDQAYCRGTEMSSTWQRFGLTSPLQARTMVVNGYGSNSFCVLASDNQAYCAGFNDVGNLGNAGSSGTAVPFSAPTKFRLDLANPGPVSGSAASLTVKKVFNQDVHTCVIASDDQAYCAGQNNYGQLGQNNFTQNVWVGKSTPGRALVPGNPPIGDIALTYHSAAEGIFYLSSSDGTVYMSGNNTQGTANDGSFTGSCANGSGSYNCYPIPRAAITSTGFTDLVSVGQEGDVKHSICLVHPASVWCIGSNGYGQLGSGDCVNKASYYGAANFAGETAVSNVNAEAVYQMNSSMFITTAGNVYAAGDNTYGKLGRGTSGTACNNTFAKVLLPSGVKALAIANADEYSSFMLGDNGRVYAVGRNNNGQLGDGTTTDRSTPVEVKLPRQETIY